MTPPVNSHAIATNDPATLRRLRAIGTVGLLTAVIFLVYLLIAQYLEVRTILFRFQLIDDVEAFIKSMPNQLLSIWMYLGIRLLLGILTLVLTWKLTVVAMKTRLINTKLSVLSMALAGLGLAAMIVIVFLFIESVQGRVIEGEAVYTRVLVSNVSSLVTNSATMFCLLLALALMSGIARQLKASKPGSLLAITTWMMLLYMGYVVILGFLQTVNMALRIALGHYFEPLEMAVNFQGIPFVTLLMGLLGIVMTIIMMFGCRGLMARAGSMMPPTAM